MKAQKREPLTQQKRYWETVLTNTEVKCIYSNIILEPQDLSLDHYLPWSFVAHDQLWNLIPTNQSINSAKSNNIPSDEYFNKFVELQYLGLTISHQQVPFKKWSKCVEVYLSELRLPDFSSLLEINQLRNAYELTLPPLITLAKIQGFNSDWIYPIHRS